jgi:hypothetical protein
VPPISELITSGDQIQLNSARARHVMHAHSIGVKMLLSLIPDRARLTVTHVGDTYSINCISQLPLASPEFLTESRPMQPQKRET